MRMTHSPHMMRRSRTYLWSFYRLLKRLRGTTPLAALAEQCGCDERLLARLEAGHRPVDEATARDLLRRGFGLAKRDIDRFILGIQLYDLGLRDNDLRQLVLDLLLKTAPENVREQLRRLYRNYAP
ncbi:MAG TPA: hypothetical protein VK689_21640 [Armatimonadota bacterium]|nr:hypothetical protein [Armatimonadota bacterium]